MGRYESRTYENLGRVPGTGQRGINIGFVQNCTGGWDGSGTGVWDGFWGVEWKGGVWFMRLVCEKGDSRGEGG